MVTGLVGVIVSNAIGFFWPANVVRVTLRDGKMLTGPVVERERVPGSAGAYRVKLNVANRDLYGSDFVWVDEAQIARREMPPDVAVIERTEWGLLIGTITSLRDGDRVIASGPAAWDEIRAAPAGRGPAAGRDPADRALRHRGHQPPPGAGSPAAAPPGARRRHERRGGRGRSRARWPSCRRATRSRRPAWPRSAAARRSSVVVAADGGEGEGAAAGPGPRRALPEPDESRRQGPPLPGQRLGAAARTTRGSRTPRAACSRPSSARS